MENLFARAVTGFFQAPGIGRCRPIQRTTPSTGLLAVAYSFFGILPAK